MMAMGALMHHMSELGRKIKSVDPATIVRDHSLHPFVMRVLKNETTFTKEVECGIKVLEKLSQGEPQYFDLTPQCGELVILLGGPHRWCCENKEPTKKESFWELVLLWGYFGTICFVTFGAGVCLWGFGISRNDQSASVSGLVLVWLPFLGYKLVHALNGNTRAEQSFNAFFRWSPIFWELMLMKAKELDAYIAFESKRKG